MHLFPTQSPEKKIIHQNKFAKYNLKNEEEKMNWPTLQKLLNKVQINVKIPVTNASPLTLMTTSKKTTLRKRKKYISKKNKIEQSK